MVSPQYECRSTRDFDLPVVCLRCDAAMTITAIVPVISFAPLNEVAYACPVCGAEMKQTVLRIDSK
jgi:hypothetical protein